MSELSDASKTILTQIHRILLRLEHIFKFFRHLIIDSVPRLVKNIVTLLEVIRDLATTFLPVKLVKIIIFTIIIVGLYAKFKRDGGKKDKIKKEERESSDVGLGSLGPQFIIKEKGTQSGVGMAQTEMDSLFLELGEEGRVKDVQDIIFFDLMRSYKQIQEEKSEQEDN